MKNRLTLAVSSALSLALGALAANAQATQDVAQAGACIAREQAQQLVDTLNQRNDQVRQTTAQLRQLEGRVVEAEAKAAQADAAQRALQIAGQRNAELVEIGKAILTDYENQTLGQRIASREPLTQLYRVRLENKLQEYEAQIAAQRFMPAVEMDAQSSSSPSITPPE